MGSHYLLYSFYLRFSAFVLLLVLPFSSAAAQIPVTCVASAVPPIVHAEGLAESLGDIVLHCSGTPGAAVTANLGILLPVSVTNRINAGSFSTDATLTINTGTGPVAAGISGFVANQSISFNGFSFTFPPAGTASITVSDLRADVHQLGVQQSMPIQAFLNGSLAVSDNPVTVAVAQSGLLATSMDAGVTCTGSAVPATVTHSGLIAAKTAEQTTRVTEGFPQAFQPKDPTSDTGTRFLLSYSNFPTGATIYVPDAVAGSGATVPTAGGDLGSPAAVGEYTPGTQTLLLVRVLNADSTGAGGTLAALPPPNGSGVIVLDGVNSVPLTNGTGYAVYEVVSANPSATERAQIPNFFAIPPNSPPATANGAVSLAPVSTVTSASATAPIPRFAAAPPPSDCSAAGDCNASYYPLLQVLVQQPQPVAVKAVAGGKRVGAANITINNTRGGVLNWSASTTYASGSGWMLLTESSGAGGAFIQAVVDPSGLTPGQYQATVVIDGGPIAGSQSIPFTVTVAAPPAPAPVTVSGVTDAADFHSGPVVPGSLVTVWGAQLSGQNVAVTFDGIPAPVLYDGAQQINLRLPPDLAGRASAQMLVTVDSAAAAPFTVQLTAAAPAVFNPGVLNQDNTVNSAAHPAPLGSVLQIFGTGMPESGGIFTVKIQNRDGLVPLYAAAAPSLPGAQQVNVAVPAGISAAPSSLVICVAVSGGPPTCSRPATIWLR